jgi:hypothetical protein
MEHIQQLTMTWLRPREAREEARQEPPARPELPSRERVRRVAELHHRQLVRAKQQTGSNYEILRAQTEALRQFMLELPSEEADVFMNMYTEESSALQREWMSRQSTKRGKQPLHGIASIVGYVVTVVVIAVAIVYFF